MSGETWINAKDRLPEAGEWFTGLLQSVQRDFDTGQVITMNTLFRGYPGSWESPRYLVDDAALGIVARWWIPLPPPPVVPAEVKPC